MEKVFSIVRQRYGHGPTDQMKDLDENTSFWRIFMSVPLQAAVHLGKDHTENLRSTKNQPLKSLRQLFQVTERLITDQTEISGLTTIDWQQAMWRERRLCRLTELFNLQLPKPAPFSDSVLCLGGISEELVKDWERFFEKCLSQRFGSDRRGADGVRG